MEKESIRHFESRSIALVGDRRMCRHLYLQFHATLNIQYYFFTKLDQADDNAELFFSDIPEIKCRYMRTQAVLEEDLLLLLCIDHAFRRDYDHLFFLEGLEWGTDYIDALYVVQYYRHQYNIELSKKNLWIFGAGNNGAYFCKIYKKVYPIKGFVSNFKEEKEYQGLPVIRPEEFLMQKNAYIVICSDADVAMEKKLCRLGLTGEKDFCFPETLPKALFHAIGTCQVVNSAEVLYRNKEFCLRYYGCRYFDNIYQPCSDADNRRMKAYGGLCDVVFYNVANAGTKEFRNYKRMTDHYYKSARKLVMPFYYFKGQIMQATDDVNPYAMRSYEEEQFWFRGDQEVNRMIEHGLAAKEIVRNIIKEDYWSKQEILERFRRELKKIEVLDRFSSIPIKSFIEKNYKKIVVFADGSHFNYPLYLYIANEIARILQIEPISDQNPVSEIPFELSVMPVYPCVRKALEMEDQNRYPFYNKEKRSLEYLDMEEYIRRYAKYVMDIRQMYQKTGTHWS